MILVQILDKLFAFFKSKKISISNSNKDDLLLYQYIDQTTISTHPLIDEYNLTRLYSIQNYLNSKIHKSKRHINLKPFYEQKEILNWLGIVSDIKRPKGSDKPPVLLIDKFAEIKNGEAKLLDNHVWLNTKSIKAMQEPKQTIAIGEAIQGISVVGAYTAKNGIEKYGLRNTILKGSGIFVGKRPRNNEATDLTAEFVTNYDRHNDWILKLTDSDSDKLNFQEQFDFNQLANLSNHHITIRYQDSNINNYISRQIEQRNREKSKIKKNTISNSASRIIKETKTSLSVQTKPLTRYYGEFLRYSYYNNTKGEFIPLITFKNITDELNQLVSKKRSFLLTENILELGQLKAEEKVIFTTKKIDNKKAEYHGKINSLKPLNSEIKRAKLPRDHNILIGLIMFNLNDQSVEHLHFLEKYRAWATENNITLPKQKNRKLINLKNKTEISQQIDISEKQFEQLIKKLRIAPKYISDNVSYYDQNAFKKLRQEIQLKKILTKAKHKNSSGIRQLSMADAERLKGDSLNATHTVLETANGSFYYAGFDTITQKEIKEVIYELSNYQQDVYLKVQRINDHKTAYICVKDIADFKTVMGDTIFYL